MSLSLVRRAVSRSLCSTCLARPRLAPTLPLPRTQARAASSTPPALRASRGQQTRDSPPSARGGGGGRARSGPLSSSATPSTSSAGKVTQSQRTQKLRPASLPRIISARLDEWTASERLEARLEAYGLDRGATPGLLRAWVAQVTRDFDAMKDKDTLEEMAKCGWDPRPLILAFEAGRFALVFESAFLRHFLEYAAASSSVPPSVALHLRSLLTAADLSNYAQSFPSARKLNRKFHLHMGPTNSGKTYNALKALARAKSGVYAGPLRLLAHEVWERINLGTVGEMNGQGRACNLITGEERRIVSHDSGLVSCTVEMVPFNGINGEPWDVVVIDEIQMMGDGQRGGAWTNAVMGTYAREIHLCGDETTAALLQNMVNSFKGDTLTVHRYDRLTPLTVANESLNNEWENVRPGDCIVTFSRTGVFGIKRKVERALGERCAVVYGALPPETRAEQARDFNDDAGRSKVLVASDAVGMGLNLLTKFDGQKDVPLSLSQVKQIAGRAGRFGQQRTPSSNDNLDEVSTPGGVVTTLVKEDLERLRTMLPLPLPPITRATMEITHDSLAQLAPLLPPSTTFADLLDHFVSLAKLPPDTVLSEIRHKLPLAEIIEPSRNTLTLAETAMFTHAPVSYRDPRVATIFANIVTAYAEEFLVGIDDVLASSGLIVTLEAVEDAVAALPPLPAQPGLAHTPEVPSVIISSIPLLEGLHKSLVLYLWLSHRLEIAFPDRSLAADYKTRTETVLEICLERLPGLRGKHGPRRGHDHGNFHGHGANRGVQAADARHKIKWEDHEASAQTRRNKRFQHASLVEDR